MKFETLRRPITAEVRVRTVEVPVDKIGTGKCSSPSFVCPLSVLFKHSTLHNRNFHQSNTIAAQTLQLRWR